MALTMYAITGDLKDQLGGESIIGDVTLTPYATTDAIVDGADVRLGSVNYDIATLPASVSLSAGPWRAIIQPRGKVNGNPQFRPLQVTFDLQANTTWGAIVSGALGPVVELTPTVDDAVAGVIGTGGQTDQALSATYGAEAVGAANGKAKFSVSDSGLFVSIDGNDANDGLSPGAAKKTVAAAIAALPTAGHGYVNVGVGAHTVNNVTLPGNLTMRGHGRRTRLVSTGNMFAVTSGLVTDVHMSNLAMLPAGSAFAISGGTLALSTFDDLYINPTGGTAPAIDAVSMIDTKWRVHLETNTATAFTVPLVRLIATTANVDAIACNSFTGRITHNSSYAFHIEDATNVSYAENNRIWDMNFEIPNKGAVKILSGTGNILDNCLAVDFSASIAVPLVKVGKSAASTKRSGGNRINWHRHGGTFGAGGYDVQLAARTDVRQTTFVDCWADTGGGFMVDFANSDATVLNTDLAGASNAGWVQGTTNRGVKFIRDNKANWVGAAAAGAGVAMWDTISNKLLISDGTAWRDTMGTVVA